MSSNTFLEFAISAIGSSHWSDPEINLNYSYSTLRTPITNTPFGVRWLSCYLPFPDNPKLICCEFLDLTTGNEVNVVFSDKPILVNSRQAERHNLSSYSQAKSVFYCQFTFNLDTKISDFILSQLQEKILAFFSLTNVSPNKIANMAIAKKVKEAINEFNLQYAEMNALLPNISWANPEARRLSQAKALLLCNPRRHLQPTWPTKTLEASHCPEFRNKKIHIETELADGDRLYERNYYTRQIKENGYIELQLLLDSGKILRYVDEKLLVEYGVDINLRDFAKLTHGHLSLFSTNFQGYLQDEEQKKQNLIGACIDKQFPIYMVDGYDPYGDRTYWPVSDVVFAAPLDFAPIEATFLPTHVFGVTSDGEDLKSHKDEPFGYIELRFKCKTEYKFDYLNSQTAFNATKGKLFIHTWDRLLSEFVELFYCEPQDWNNKAFENLNGFEEPFDSADWLKTSQPSMVEQAFAMDFVISVKGHDNISNKLHILRTKLQSFFDCTKIRSLEMQFDSLTVDASPGGVKFWLQYSSPESHTKNSSSPHLYLTHFSDWWNTIFTGFHSGFSGVISDAFKDDLAGRKKLNRQENLRLLRHNGAYVFILHSVLNWLYEDTKENRPRKQLEKEILSKLELLLRPKNLTRISEIGFASVYSKKLEKFISTHIDTCLHYLEEDQVSEVFNGNRAFQVRGLNYHQGKIVYFLLNQLIDSTKGALFSSSKYKYFELLRSTISPEPADWQTASSLEEDVYDHIGVAVFHSQDELLASPDTATFLADQTEERMKHYSWLKWPAIKSKFDYTHVILSGKAIETLSPEAFQFEFSVTAAESTQDTQRPINWFDLHPQYFLNGKPITASAAQNLAHQGIVEHDGKFYLIDLKKLPTQKALELFWHKLAGKSAEHENHSGRHKDKGQARTRHHILELLALRRMGIPFKGPKEWTAICDYFDALSDPKQNIELTAPLNAILKPYQKMGVQWLSDLYHLQLGGILADDMGLGKTLQTLSFIDQLKAQNKPHRSLVVVPVSLTYNWISEAEKFTPHLKVVLFDPAKDIHEDTDLMICTYGLFSLHHEKLTAGQFQCVFFDEAQNLKNRGTERFDAAVKLVAPFKVALTGTPLENHLGNLYALMAVVAPGVLGDYSEFAREYVKSAGVSEESILFLRSLLKPLILRRTKEQILTELPAKTETQIKIDFSPKQKNLYKKTALAYSEKISEIVAKEGENRSQLQMLTALLRLRQICSDPSALPGIKFNEVPPKLECLFEMLEEIVDEGHSVLLFTQFMATFNRIKSMALERKIPLLSICGADSSSSRSKTLEEFNMAPAGSVLLMTLKTGGVGLNLTKASYVFHLEPWWNPAVENQATDRVHRMGQTKSISVYRLIMKESVEEKVEMLKARKGALFNQMFSENYFSKENCLDDDANSDRKTTSSLTKSDFDLLLG